jgi:hypothetical protein
MKKSIIYLLFYCLCYFAGNHTLNAQKIDSLKPKKEMKGTLWLGTNISMPIFALGYGGSGGEINSLYLVSNHLALSFGGGATNYREIGLKTAKNYSSSGFHFRGGIAIDMIENPDAFVFYKSGISNKEVKGTAFFGLNFVWARVNETGYWNPDTNNTPLYYYYNNVSNVDYWGSGLGFDVIRNIYGIELSSYIMAKFNHRHVVMFKPYFSLFTYDNKSYFPLASASGFGYTPFTSVHSDIGMTMGMQLWYYFRVK